MAQRTTGAGRRSRRRTRTRSDRLKAAEELEEPPYSEASRTLMHAVPAVLDIPGKRLGRPGAVAAGGKHGFELR
jgi:hypothetical protein